MSVLTYRAMASIDCLGLQVACRSVYISAPVVKEAMLRASWIWLLFSFALIYCYFLTSCLYLLLLFSDIFLP